MTNDLTALEALCRAATPGPWGAVSTHAEGGDQSDEYWVKAQPHPALRGFTKDVAMVDGEPNAAYIAAAHPAAVLALIERVRRAEEERDQERASCAQADAIIEYLRAEPWLPIETAPKDGTPVLVISTRFSRPLYSVEVWENGRWQNDEGLTVGGSHWRPLPAAPRAAEKKE